MLEFDGAKTKPIAFNASAQLVREALEELNHLVVGVNGPSGGPYTVDFYGPVGEVAQPLIVADASGLTPSGSKVSVVTTQTGGVAYDASYHFEYVSQKQFEAPGGEGGFARAVSTPEVYLGGGAGPRFAGQDLPGLKAGETYDYRIVAASTYPGDPVIDGATHSLTVPLVEVQAPPGCSNEAFRVGASADLSGCRAYEQVTPVEKEGAMELFKYSTGALQNAAVGEDGEHLELEAPVTVFGSGSGSSSGQSPYFFSRTPGGWRMVAAATQPATGVKNVIPEVFGSDLTQFGFESEVLTSPTPGGESTDIEFKAGVPGAAYTTVAVIPRKEAGLGWVAASADFSKAILQSEDHTLAGASGTVTGEDLYEYADGALHRVNVNSEGKKLEPAEPRSPKAMENRIRVETPGVLTMFRLTGRVSSSKPCPARTARNPPICMFVKMVRRRSRLGLISLSPRTPKARSCCSKRSRTGSRSSSPMNPNIRVASRSC